MSVIGNVMGDLFGDNGANDTVKQALAQINQVQTPTAADMRVKLQKLVQMGVLTPQQAETFLTGPNAYNNISTNPLGTSAQVDAIKKLQEIAASGGMDAQEAADLQQIIQGINTQEKGQRGAILQSQAERGALTGGETVAAQLEANQSDAANANQQALASNATAEQRALSALTTAGSMGTQLEGQQFGEQGQKASAENAIEQFNAQQKAEANRFNASTANAAQATNLGEAQRISDTNTENANTNAVRDADLIQQQFADQMAKASAAAGESNTAAELEQKQAQANEQFVGGLIGAGGQAGGSALGTYLKSAGPVAMASRGGVVPMESGGKVPGRALTPGDSVKNDRVPAILSPGEVVIPRTATVSPDKTLAFLARMRKPPAPHPEDVATVLRALHHVRQGA